MHVVLENRVHVQINLPHKTQPGRERLRAMKHQRDDGLWAVYVKRPDLTQDTAGSSGIAASLAIGDQQGWLDESAREAAERTLSGLKPHLTPDGFLSGAGQSNKGGGSLQSGNCRVIYQMAMGLMGQLIAALDV
jgi:unsaturated rhamnogalacturonyl hydrolase